MCRRCRHSQKLLHRLLQPTTRGAKCFVGNLEVLNFDSHFPNGHHLGKRKIEPKIDGLCVLGNLMYKNLNGHALYRYSSSGHSSQVTIHAACVPTTSSTPQTSICKMEQSNHIEPAACTKRACEVCNFPIDDADEPLHLGCPLLILFV